MKCKMCDSQYRLTRTHDLVDGEGMTLCASCVRYLRGQGAETNEDHRRQAAYDAYIDARIDDRAIARPWD